MIARSWLWAAGIAALLGALALLASSGHLKLQNDLLALLPQAHSSPIETAAMQRIATLGEHRLVILIGDRSDSARRSAATAAAHTLTGSDAFVHVITGASDALSTNQQQALKQLFFQHRFHLLAPADMAALEKIAKHPTDAALQHFTQRAQTQLYGLGVGGGRFIDDPFGLSQTYQNTLSAGFAAPGLKIASDGHFMTQGKDGERYAVIFAQTRQDAFAMSAQARQSADLNAALRAAREAAPDAKILVSGVLRHAVAATRQAKHEVTFIGSGSLLGIVLLMLWAFSGVRPLLLSVAAVSGGCLLALVATASLFGRVHVLTLVFGASLVGVAIDYCFHFFCQRWASAESSVALRRILPAISLGLITSVLAYGAMALAPFPGLRQMAVFAAFGLIGAWLGVLLLLPALAGPAPRVTQPLRLARLWLTHGPTGFAARHEGWVLTGLAAAFVVCAALALAWLNPNDDIRQLYNSEPQLLHDEQQVAQLLGAHGTGHALVVYANSPTQVLENEAAIVKALQTTATPVAQVTAITQAYPPPAQQRHNYQLLSAQLYQAGGPLDQLLSGLKFSHEKISKQHQDFAAAKNNTLAFKHWLNSAAGTAFKPLWLGQMGEHWGALIVLHKVNNPQRLAAVLANHKQVVEINRVAQVSALLTHYRQLASWCLAAAYCLAGLLLWWVLGGRGALIVLLPPLLASAATALIFALTNWPFSIFNLMAMILLLGMGADYGIFLRMAERDAAPALTAVTLSAATTLLAFGLLAASHTPALHSFGLTLALGLGSTFVLAALIGGGRKVQPA